MNILTFIYNNFTSFLAIFLGSAFVVYTFRGMLKSYGESKENLEKEHSERKGHFL